jgi:hypothetical protein
MTNIEQEMSNDEVAPPRGRAASAFEIRCSRFAIRHSDPLTPARQPEGQDHR